MVLYHSFLSASSVIPLDGIIGLLLFNIYIAHQPTSTNISIAEYTDDKAIIASHINPIITIPDIPSH